jgi:hypothetical protein
MLNIFENRDSSFAGKDTLRCLALALKRMPAGQQSICYDDEANLTFIGLVCFVTLLLFPFFLCYVFHIFPW